MQDNTVKNKLKPNFNNQWLKKVSERLIEIQNIKTCFQPEVLSQNAPTSASGSTQFASPRISNNSPQFGKCDNNINAAHQMSKIKFAFQAQSA